MKYTDKDLLDAYAATPDRFKADPGDFDPSKMTEAERKSAVKTMRQVLNESTLKHAALRLEFWGFADDAAAEGWAHWLRIRFDVPSPDYGESVHGMCSAAISAGTVLGCGENYALVRALRLTVAQMEAATDRLRKVARTGRVEP